MSACKTIYLKALKDLMSLVQITKTVIDRFFPAIKVTGTYIGKMEVKATVNTPVFVLLRWIQTYPGKKLDPVSQSDLAKLKALYISLNMDWEADPILLEGMVLGLI